MGTSHSVKGAGPAMLTSSDKSLLTSDGGRRKDSFRKGRAGSHALPDMSSGPDLLLSEVSFFVPGVVSPHLHSRTRVRGPPVALHVSLHVSQHISSES